MARVKLGDVAREHKETYKGDKDRFPIVGLEHLKSEDILLRTWDENIENTFSKMFRKGHVLFGRRRAYLRKAVVAPFDGICSGDITVIEAMQEKILPELLPFIIQHERLFNYAESKSAGSLSPRVKWEHLKDYEFTLPSTEEQKSLAELLWAANETKEAYKKLLALTDDLVKSQFIEMFGEPVINPMGWPVKSLSEYIKFLTSGSRGWAGYFSDEGEMFLTIKNVKNSNISTDNIQYVCAPVGQEAIRTKVVEGDLLISITADLGRTGIVTKNIADYGAYINQHLSLVRLDKSRINPRYVSYFLESESGKRQFETKNQTGVKAGLNFNSINSLQIVVPTLELQNSFISFIQQTDKSKFELQQTITSLENTIKSLMMQHIG